MADLGQIRSVFNVHAVVAHACHGHRYRPFSGTGKKASKGGPPALADTREYEQFDRNR